MISLCTTYLSPMERYLGTFLESAKLLNCVSEICITHTFTDENKPTTERTITRHDGKEIVVKEITLCKDDQHHKSRFYGHAEGLHKCLEHATQEYVLFSDPDVFFYKGADQFYLDAFKKYDLNIIGVCHHHAALLGVGWFPYIINCMVKRDTLPEKEWMKDYLKYGRHIFQHWLGYGALDQEGKIVLDLDGTPICEENMVPCPGKFLIQGAIPEFVAKFPHYNKEPKEGVPYIFDAACNFYLWNLERNGKWISFPTLDTHTYSAGVSRNNFKMKGAFKNQKLIWHLDNGWRCCAAREDGPDILEREFQNAINLHGGH